VGEDAEPGARAGRALATPASERISHSVNELAAHPDYVRFVTPTETKLYGRRAFLGVTGLGLSSLLWGQGAWNALSGVARPIESALPPSLVPNGWRIYTVAATMPRFDPAAWRLKVGGLVEHPLELDYDALRALPRTEEIATFHCVTGWSVPNVRWAGVRLSDLIDRVQPSQRASVLGFISAESPYFDTLTLQQARLRDAMLAYEMDGKPLPREHGAPVRLVIPEMYGYKNVKWVQQIVFADRVVPGYWEQRGYDVDAWVGHSNGL
jgi:DMSO/TMAO reductase YedYZ molybdopterin-dependent catalytic subunit